MFTLISFTKATFLTTVAFVQLLLVVAAGHKVAHHKQMHGHKRAKANLVTIESLLPKTIPSQLSCGGFGQQYSIDFIKQAKGMVDPKKVQWKQVHTSTFLSRWPYSYGNCPPASELPEGQFLFIIHFYPIHVDKRAWQMEVLALGSSAEDPSKLQFCSISASSPANDIDPSVLYRCDDKKSAPSAWPSRVQDLLPSPLRFGSLQCGEGHDYKFEDIANARLNTGYDGTATADWYSSTEILVATIDPETAGACQKEKGLLQTLSASVPYNNGLANLTIYALAKSPDYNERFTLLGKPDMLCSIKLSYLPITRPSLEWQVAFCKVA